jgi:hypothetical protein
MREMDSLKDLDVYMKITLKRIKEIHCCKIVEWVNLVQDRKKLWAVVNTVMNLRAPYTVENILTI